MKLWQFLLNLQEKGQNRGRMRKREFENSRRISERFEIKLQHPSFLLARLRVKNNSPTQATEAVKKLLNVQPKIDNAEENIWKMIHVFQA